MWQAANELTAPDQPNIRYTVPFFGVRDMDASLRFYVDGLGFAMTRHWDPDGRIRWCWLERDNASVMLQEFWNKGEHGDSPGPPEGTLGQGVSICFMCGDAIAIYKDALARGLNPSHPFVGNGLWVTNLVDPDGFRLEFESPTDVPEGTKYSG
jgi:catechol 2,3-dioxygenase-like lactoylglutathione lyase family enzyme